jgi:hypothetical protein
MHRIGTLPGSFNDFVLLVKGVPAPIEVSLALRYFALELETPNVSQNVSPACQSRKEVVFCFRSMAPGHGFGPQEAAASRDLHLAKGILVWSDFRPRWGGKFVIKVIRR